MGRDALTLIRPASGFVNLIPCPVVIANARSWHCRLHGEPHGVALGFERTFETALVLAAPLPPQLCLIVSAGTTPCQFQPNKGR